MILKKPMLTPHIFKELKINMVKLVNSKINYYLCIMVKMVNIQIPTEYEKYSNITLDDAKTFLHNTQLACIDTVKRIIEDYKIISL